MTVECASCGGRFTAKRATAKFCSPRCRQRAKRAPEGAPPRREGGPLVALPPATPVSGGMVAVTEAALAEAGRVDTPLGQATLLIARILDSGVQDTGSSIAALVRQYQASLEKALDGAKQEADPLDQILARRQQRRA